MIFSVCYEDSVFSSLQCGSIRISLSHLFYNCLYNCRIFKLDSHKVILPPSTKALHKYRIEGKIVYYHLVASTMLNTEMMWLLEIFLLEMITLLGRYIGHVLHREPGRGHSQDRVSWTIWNKIEDLLWRSCMILYVFVYCTIHTVYTQIATDVAKSPPLPLLPLPPPPPLPPSPSSTPPSGVGQPRDTLMQEDDEGGFAMLVTLSILPQ